MGFLWLGEHAIRIAEEEMALGNRLVGILDGCLRHRQLYSEEIAWPNSSEEEAAA